MSEYDTSPEACQQCLDTQARVAAWLENVDAPDTQIDTLALTSIPSIPTATALGPSSHPIMRCSTKGSFSARKMPAAAFSKRNLSTEAGTLSVSPIRTSGVASWPHGYEPPTPTSTTFGPPSIYTAESGRESDGGQVHPPYVDMDCSSDPDMETAEDGGHIHAFTQRKGSTSAASTSLVPSYYGEEIPDSPCIVSPVSAAYFYARQSTYYLPTDTSAPQEPSPHPEASCPSLGFTTPASATLSCFPSPPSTLPDSRHATHLPRHRSPSSAASRPGAYQRSSSSSLSLTSTINVTVSLGKAQGIEYKTTEDYEGAPTIPTSRHVAQVEVQKRQGQRGLVILVISG